MSWALGIDLGTSFTAGGVVADGRLDVIGLGAHAAAILSAVYRSEDATLFGEAALVRGGANPDPSGARVQTPVRRARSHPRR